MWPDVAYFEIPRTCIAFGREQERVKKIDELIILEILVLIAPVLDFFEEDIGVVLVGDLSYLFLTYNCPASPQYARFLTLKLIGSSRNWLLMLFAAIFESFKPHYYISSR